MPLRADEITHPPLSYINALNGTNTGGAAVLIQCDTNHISDFIFNRINRIPSIQPVLHSQIHLVHRRIIND